MPADITTVTATITGHSAATLAVGDQVGAEMTISSAAQSSGKGGIILSATLFDANTAKASAGDFELWVFEAASTPAADNAPADWSDTNIRLLIPGGRIIFRQADWVINASNAVNTQQNLNIGYTCSGSANLFGNFVTRVGITSGFGSGEVVCDLSVLRHA